VECRVAVAFEHSAGSQAGSARSSSISLASFGIWPGGWPRGERGGCDGADDVGVAVRRSQYATGGLALWHWPVSMLRTCWLRELVRVCWN
jgi:hypothetical protein